ncbi:MAG: energy-coupling factor transporter transmembrane component T [Candidatus Izemoplasmatales bacterium]|nr:energy-coupling factor transporter transmembrane component T [Candidatus Izemoplasmatales bacterium]
MANIALGRYVPYNSFIHRLDPRLKLFGLIVLMVGIFIKFVNVPMNFIVYGLIFILIAMMMMVSRIKFKTLFKQLKALWIMITFLLIINTIVPNSGAIAFSIGSWNIYWNAIFQTLYIVIRLVLMIALTMVLTSTTRPLDLTYAIEWYLLPFKVIRFPTHEIAMTISIALRFIPTLLDETYRIMKAQASRGVDFVSGKLSEKVRAIVSLIVPLFISAFQRSEELANAMEARGYNPSGKRTRYRVMKWRVPDSIALIFVVGLLSGIIVLAALKVDFVAIIGNLF